MFRSIGLVWLVGSVLLGLTVSAQAQDSQRLEANFKKADTDSDGSLTREEAKAMPAVAKRFDMIDADQSGTVTMDEIRTSMRDHKKEMKEHRRDMGIGRFRAADKNGDNALSREEAADMPEITKRFDDIDADKSGTITEQELRDYKKQRRAEREE